MCSTICFKHAFPKPQITKTWIIVTQWKQIRPVPTHLCICIQRTCLFCLRGIQLVAHAQWQDAFVGVLCRYANSFSFKCMHACTHGFNKSDKTFYTHHACIKGWNIAGAKPHHHKHHQLLFGEHWTYSRPPHFDLRGEKRCTLFVCCELGCVGPEGK